MATQKVGQLDLAPPPQADSPVQVFTDLAKLYKWEDKVRKYILETLKLTSLEEFSFLIQKPGDVQEKITGKVQLGDLAGQQSARVMQAWTQVKKAME